MERNDSIAITSLGAHLKKFMPGIRYHELYGFVALTDTLFKKQWGKVELALKKAINLLDEEQKWALPASLKKFEPLQFLTDYAKTNVFESTTHLKLFAD